MGRKRLMSVLAGVIAVVGLHAAPAAALPGVNVDASDDLTVEVEEAIDDVVEVDPKVEVEVAPKPKATVDGGAKAADEKVDAEKVDAGAVTKAPQQKVEGSAQPPAPKPAEAPVEDAAATAEQVEAEPAPEDDQVTAAGTTSSISLERAAQIEAFRAMRDAGASFFGDAQFDGRVVPGVQLAPRLTNSDTFFTAAPEVAPSVEVAAPESSVAPQEAPRSAELASAPFSGVLPEVPIALQLLAGTLVVGAALAWHIARRELEASPLLRRVAD
jgi:hypothetical protein